MGLCPHYNLELSAVSSSPRGSGSGVGGEYGDGPMAGLARRPRRHITPTTKLLACENYSLNPAPRKKLPLTHPPESKCKRPTARSDSTPRNRCISLFRSAQRSLGIRLGWQRYRRVAGTWSSANIAPLAAKFYKPGRQSRGDAATWQLLIRLGHASIRSNNSST